MNDEPELRPCPFCGVEQVQGEKSGGTRHPQECPLFGVWIPTEKFNTRPLEDALRAELEAAKQIAENFKQHFTATGGSSVGSKCEWEWNYEGAIADCHHYEEVIASLKERAEAAEARVAELEAQCAIEPGQESTYDVSESVAKAMWRFWFRMAKIQGKKVAELEAHFPRTKDGVAVTPGMVVYCPLGHEIKAYQLRNWTRCEAVTVLFADCTANPPGDAEVEHG